MALWTPATTGAAALPAGLELWLPPASSNFTLSGSSITSWNDLSGNARDMSLVSGGAEATFSSSAGGTGYPGMVCAGNGPYGWSGALTPAGAGGINLNFFAVGSTSASNVNGARMIDVVATGGFDDYNSGIAAIFDYGGGGTTIGFQTGAGNTNVGGYTVGAVTMFEALFDGTTGYIRRNGVAEASGTAPLSTFGWTTYEYISITGRNNGGPCWNGNILEVIVYSGLLSATVTVDQGAVTVQQLLEGYLAWNNGIQGDLPGGHPFASAAPSVTTAPTLLQLLASTTISIRGSAGMTGTASLSGSTLARVTGKAGPSGKAPLAASTSTQVKGSAGISGKIPLGARTMLAATARAGQTVIAHLGASTKISAMGKAGGGTYTARLSAATKAAVKGGAALTGRASLAARTLTQVTGSAGMTGKVVLQAATRTAATGQAGLTGKVKIAASTIAAAFGRASLTGKASLQTKGSVQVKGVAGISGKVVLQAITRAMASGQAGISGRTKLAASTIVAAFGRAKTTGKVGLSAATMIATTARTSLIGKLALSARTMTAASGTAYLTGIVQVAALSARTLVAVFGKAAMFLPSSRVARTQNLSRTVAAPASPRTVQAPVED